MASDLSSLDDDWIAVRKGDLAGKENASSSKYDAFVRWNTVDSRAAITFRAKSRSSNDVCEDVYSTTATINELHCINSQLGCLNELILAHFPDIPEEPRSIFSIFQVPACLSETQCVELERYFRTACVLCGERQVLSLLFDADGTLFRYDDHFEEFNDFREAQLRKEIVELEKQLAEFSAMGKSSVRKTASTFVNMLELLDRYAQEDAMMDDYESKTHELYMILLQPLADYRELALARNREARRNLQRTDIGEKRRADFRSEFETWKKRYEDTLANISA